MMMRRILLGLSLAICVVGQTNAQTPGFSALEGRSIVSDYEEEILSKRSGSFNNKWHDELYFSTKGRIFHRLSMDNGRRGDHRNRDSVSEEDGSNDGQGAAFRWIGNGVMREWTNRRGIRLRQSILVYPSADGYSCKASVERNGRSGNARVIRENCRVVLGNVLSK